MSVAARCFMKRSYARSSSWSTAQIIGRAANGKTQSDTRFTRNWSAAIGRMWPYLAALAVALAIVVAVPWLSVGFL